MCRQIPDLLDGLEGTALTPYRRIDFAVGSGESGSNSPEEFKSFMVQVYREFIRFRNGSGYFVKLIGDGLMAIKELTPKNSISDATALLCHSYELTDSIEKKWPYLEDHA